MAPPSQTALQGADLAYDRSTMSASLLPILLGFLTAVGPLSTDVYLPAFPAMESSLHTTPGGVQFTLSIWFLGLAIGQITVGSLSDRFGRKLPLMAGNMIFALASVVCAAAPDIEIFSVARFIASIGASASLVIPTACVRDLVQDRNAGAKMMSQLVMVMGVVPVAAPMLGGFVVTFVSWRVIFWASALYGFLCVLLVTRSLPETLPAEFRTPLSPITIVERFLILLRDRGFATDALVGGFSTFLSFSYLTAASPVFIEVFGFTPIQFSALFGGFAVFMIGASQVNGYLVGKLDSGRLLTGSVATALVGAAVLTAICTQAALHPVPHGGMVIVPLIIAVMALTLGSTGLIYPNATMGALADHPRLAGAASALCGTIQYTFGAVAGCIIGWLPAGTPLPMAACMLLGAMLMMGANLLRPGRH